MGQKHSPEARAKMSAAQKGRPGHPHTVEARAKISAAQKGRKKSVEARAKISAAKRRRYIRTDLLDQFEAFLGLHETGRSEPAMSLDPALPTIRLGRPGEPTFIDGQKVKPLNPPQYDIISMLLDAGPEGLTTGQIEARTEHSGWRATLRTLKKNHLWDRVIIFPGVSHGRYRIAAVRLAV
jgi:NUMOD3 motif